MSNDYPCRLYLVSPPKIVLAAFAKQLEEAFAGGDVACFQLRLKEAEDATIAAAVKALQPIVRAAGAAFILNDRVGLAKTLNADGVHLGQDDMRLREARAILGEEKIIGITCHDSKHFAMEAGEAGADYVAFGAFYPTTSKSPEKLARYGTPTTELLEFWSTYTTVPCVAIGGITPENCAPLVKAGADFVAAITSVWNHSQGAGQAVKEFNAAIKEASIVR